MKYDGNRTWLPSALLVAAAACLPLAGCGGGPSDVAEVSGVVTLDGSPLADASVSFLPEDGRPSGATTDADGEYRLMYTPGVLGAKIGKHTVRITMDDQGDGTQSELPAKYNEQSELTADVEPGSNEIDFELTSN